MYHLCTSFNSFLSTFKFSGYLFSVSISFSHFIYSCGVFSAQIKSSIQEGFYFANVQLCTSAALITAHIFALKDTHRHTRDQKHTCPGSKLSRTFHRLSGSKKIRHLRVGLQGCKRDQSGSNTVLTVTSQMILDSRSTHFQRLLTISGEIIDKIHIDTQQRCSGKVNY